MSPNPNDPPAQDFGRFGPPSFDPAGPFPPEARRKHGCFFYGCITALVLMLLLVLALFLVYRYFAGQFRYYVETYTESAPKQLPTVEMPEAQREATIQRAQQFQKLVQSPTLQILSDDKRTLILTADELNALFEQSPEIRGKFHVAIVGDHLKAQVSLPLSELPLLKGRYLNGEADVDVSVAEGRPVVHLRNVRVKGLPLPEELRAGIEQMNLAGEEFTNPDGTASQPLLARKLEKIEIKDNKLIIIVRKEPGAPAPDSAKAERPVPEKADDSGHDASSKPAPAEKPSE